MPEDLFHADTQTDGWTDRHKYVTVRFPDPLIDVNETRIFWRDFWKFTKFFLYDFKSRGTDIETGGNYESNCTTFVRHYNCAAPLQKTCEISCLLTDSGAHTTLLSVRSTQLNTRSIGWHKRFDFRKSRFPIPRWKSIILNLIAKLSGNTSHYITTTAFLAFPIYYKLQNAQWSDECSLHKISPDINFICKLHVTIKLLRAAKGKKGQRQFTYHLFRWITEIKTNMLLITFLGLIATLTSVSGDCDVGTRKVRNINWKKLGINVLTWFLKQVAF